ncbi:unnamed protein product (macronuclear) [Paramecium tetraurelia]|uniref:Myb-like domain-containing protein n=1 Tax=Paramecium tetraurelia TaxID=5888 RepID=A0BCS5_PARTE|nr:uncharacterized protein GSPATT00004436001 [Paramecium tetraurelia]CAK56342.1 unnamed protein product [Paramecium tetraurelia]|eukprot:XP_001423740.1 hypothetical protein (macronuclear) [Paramecium tetraurelia strain d4-2]
MKLFFKFNSQVFEDRFLLIILSLNSFDAFLLVIKKYLQEFIKIHVYLYQKQQQTKSFFSMLDEDCVYLSQNEISSQNHNEISKNSYQKLKDLVPPQGKVQKLKRNYKSKLWNETNTELLYRLNAIFSGSIDMIYNYFKNHVDINITLKKIKQKYKQEQRNNPDKLFDKRKKPKLTEKHQRKLEQVAKMQTLNLVPRWSQVSEIDKDQIQGENQQDTEIQQNIFNEINQLMKTNRLRQVQQRSQQQSN